MSGEKLPTFAESATLSSLVLRQGLRSTDATVDGDGIGAPARIDTIAEYNIDALNGVNPGFVATANRPRGIEYDVSGNNLEDEHYYHIEISREHFEFDTTQDNFLMSNGSGGITHLNGSGQQLSIGTEPGSNTDYKLCKTNVSFNGKDDFISIGISCLASEGFQRVFIDGLEANPATFNSGDVPPLTGVYGDFIGAGLTFLISDWRGDGSASSFEFFERNFFILNEKVTIGYNDDLGVFNIGDSLSVEASNAALTGDPFGTMRAAWIPTTIDAVASPTNFGNGFMSDGITASNASNFKDAGLVTAFYKVLAKNDPPIRPSGANSVAGSNGNYAVTGGTIATADTKLAQGLASGYEPTTVVSLVGTNNALAGAPISNGLFESQYKATIARAAAAGVTRFIACTFTALNNDPANDNPTIEGLTAGYNAVIRRLEGFLGITKTVDLFTKFTPNFVTDPNNYRAVDNIHYNESFSNAIGIEIATVGFFGSIDLAGGLASVIEPIIKPIIQPIENSIVQSIIS